MYNELYFKTHLRKLMMLINDNIKKKKKKLCFLIMPQLHDLYLIKKNLPNYQNFYHEMSKKNKLNILDLTNSFLNLKNFSKVYLEDKYGGHLNKRGNTFVANQFYRYIKMKNFMIIWFTGISGVGKTLIAKKLFKILKKNKECCPY